MSAPSPPLATIDIGTNSVLLLIVQAEGAKLSALVDEATITRLGQGVGARRALAPEAIERTLACLEGYARTMARLGVGARAAVATSAMRDAENGEVFLERAAKVLATRPEVISGQREAALTFAGALQGIDVGDRIAVVDVGGGSTEIIVGGRDGSIERAVSLDVGAVRLTERHVHSDPPTPEELAAVRSDAAAALRQSPDLHGLPLVAVAGTATTLAALIHGIVPYRSEAVHGSRITGAAVDALIDRLARQTLAERQRISGLEPGRADVIVAGATLIACTARAAGADAVVVSDRGVRWGLARELADRCGMM